MGNGRRDGTRGLARRRHVGPAVAALVSALLVVLFGGSARAAPPTNDVFAGATPAVVGFSESLDTTEATTDADDAEVNAMCGAPATDASVWYSFTTEVDRDVVVDVSGSDYSAGVAIVTGEPGSFALVTCGAGTVVFFAEAGIVYHVLAFDDQFDGGGNGGTLAIAFTEVPPPPTVEVTVDPQGSFDGKTGVARIHGTFTCTDASFINLNGEARQSVGRVSTVLGSFSFNEVETDTCNGEPHPWEADVLPSQGKFAGGKAMTVTFSFACGLFFCSNGFTEQTVQLRGR
jgi:hypothetical protein